MKSQTQHNIKKNDELLKSLNLSDDNGILKSKFYKYIEMSADNSRWNPSDDINELVKREIKAALVAHFMAIEVEIMNDKICVCTHIDYDGFFHMSVPLTELKMLPRNGVPFDQLTSENDLAEAMEMFDSAIADLKKSWQYDLLAKRLAKIRE